MPVISRELRLPHRIRRGRPPKCPAEPSHPADFQRLKVGKNHRDAVLREIPQPRREASRLTFRSHDARHSDSHLPCAKKQHLVSAADEATKKPQLVTREPYPSTARKRKIHRKTITLGSGKRYGSTQTIFQPIRPPFPGSILLSPPLSIEWSVDKGGGRSSKEEERK